MLIPIAAGPTTARPFRKISGWACTGDGRNRCRSGVSPARRVRLRGSAGARQGTAPVFGVGAGETDGAADADAPTRTRTPTVSATNVFHQRIRAMVPGAAFRT